MWRKRYPSTRAEANISLALSPRGRQNSLSSLTYPSFSPLRLVALFNFIFCGKMTYALFGKFAPCWLTLVEGSTRKRAFSCFQLVNICGCSPVYSTEWMNLLNIHTYCRWPLTAAVIMTSGVKRDLVAREVNKMSPFVCFLSKLDIYPLPPTKTKNHHPKISYHSTKSSIMWERRCSDVLLTVSVSF